jgi:high-affinity iron transporter
MTMYRIARFIAPLLVLFASWGAFAQGALDSAPTILHLLDYIAVDYSEAVEGGKIKNADEFKEMSEFSAQVGTLLKALPDNDQHEALAKQAARLAEMVANKAEPPRVAEAATSLRWAVIRAYKVSVAPKRAPDVARGAVLYKELCTGCHGVEGRGDGIAAKGMDPAPSNFHDKDRMAQRSAYGLYNTITLGVNGTGMAAFAQLSEDDRWALAFHVAGYPLLDARAKGEALWKQGQTRAAFPDLGNVATLSTIETRAKSGEEAALVQAFLLASPQTLAAEKPAPLDVAVKLLGASLESYRAGNKQQASQQAITAYLEGFELVESSLANVDSTLNLAIERELMTYRSLLQAGAPLTEVEKQHVKVSAMLGTAREKLGAGALSETATFLASLFILLREGLEAILVVAAILAFLGKAGRADAKRYVHAGWIAALALGAITWVVATYVVNISGANREITEGITALIAAAMLLYVGYWLHSKSHAAAWQQFIREHVGGALSKGTVWTLATVSFLAVYREAFETVLFYQALFAQAGAHGLHAIWGGIALAFVLLAVVGWIIMKASVKLPIALFFAASGILLALLAIVFTGQGVAALQEAGQIDVSAVEFVSVPMLGIFPTMQSLGAQAVVAVAVIVGYLRMRRPRAAQ